MDIRDQLARGKETVAFRAMNDCQGNREYGHIYIDVVHVIPERGRYNDSIGFYDNYFDQKHQFKGLTISCQMDNQSELPYGWNISVKTDNSNGLDLSRAEEIVKTLRPINKKLIDICDKEGHVDTFEEYVIRLTRVLCIKSFYMKKEGDIQFMRNDNIGGLRNYLRTLIKENQVKLGYSQAA